MFCYGKFCGRFPDEHSHDMDDEGEDAEAGNSNSVYANMVAPKKEPWRCCPKRKASSSQTPTKVGPSGQSAKLQWRNHLTIIKAAMKSTKGGQETLQKVAVLSAKNEILSDGALASIPDVGQVHTVDLDGCKVRDVPPYLNNIETLVILKLQHNSIRRCPKELGQCTKLEVLHLGYNHISIIDREMFSESAFSWLEVINLRHNRLVVLPQNFGLTSRPCRIKHVDIAENNLQAIPDMIATCHHLQFLDISKNRITALPSKFTFPRLTKLFMSFNQLIELPECIGDCKVLEKIRMSHNQVRRLPDNLLNLRGILQEFTVEGNPLVVPSITAFEMGGLEQAFKLLDEHVRNATKAQALPALMPSEDTPALDNEAAGQQLALDMEAHSHTAHEGHVQEPHVAHNDENFYYFSHCFGPGHNPQEEIQEIRNAESTLLIIKKNLYFRNQVALAKTAKESGEENVPTTLRKFLDPGFDVSKWHGVSRVTDLDLYFNLLVYSTRPLFSTCYTLFDKFETEEKGYLNKDEWNEFVMCSPVLLEDPKINEGTWQLMAWRANDRIELRDFIAAWHIHDVEHQDPIIQRVAKVLRLDYYDMSIQELQNRLHSKDSEDATPMLDFDESSSDEDLGAKDHEIKLDRKEGERWVLPASSYAASGKENTGTPRPTQRTLMVHNGNSDSHSTQHGKVCMTDAEYAEFQAAQDQDAASDGEKSDISLRSDELSETSEEDLEEFRVEDHLTNMGVSSAGDVQVGDLQVRSDAALQQLMDVDPKSFFKRMAKGKTSGVDAKAPSREAQKGKKKPTKVVSDSRFKTDVYPVRQEIRCVFRNLPYDDFVKLINFLLRGMQMIKHSRRGATYWHADDPTFKFTMGVSCSNLYTRRLLLDMGFALVDNLYWVWPVTHLQEVKKLAEKGVPVWGDEEIPRSCPGWKTERLDDMIALLRNCQKRLHKLGKDFNGNFP
jgi:hypothetical protein